MPAVASERAAVPAQEALSQRHILRFYSPLALSWIFMALEGPVSIALISRLPHPQVNTAAFLVMMGLAIWIESPVIDLLTTSTTLAKSRRNYAILSRFVWWLMLWVTLAHALVAATPLYYPVVRGILGVGPEVADAVRPGLIAMIPWSAFIGWRRYLQGIMIRYGHTRLIGMGTGVRVITMTVGGILLYLTTALPGILLVAIALVASVALECLFVHFASRPVIRANLVHEEIGSHEPPVTSRKLLAFHLPLTATTMVMLMASPVVAAALARTQDAVLAMASWQVASAVVFLHRTVVFALPEVVIALYRDEASAAALRRFCVAVGAAASGLLLFFGLTGLDRLFFVHVLRTQHDIADAAHLAYLASCLLPFLGALHSYIRGMLTAHHLTVARLFAIAVAMICLVIGLGVGVALGWPGVVVAATALTFGMLAELLALARSWRRGMKRLARAEARMPVV